MIIRAAQLSEFQEVRAFYHAIIDGIGDSAISAGWKKDVYPAPEFLHESIRAGELFIAEEDDSIVGAMVLNHQGNESYKSFRWPTEASDGEVTVIHALGVHPSYTRRGFAKQMVRFALDRARAQRQKTVRLDVLKGNLYAEKLYAGMGFRYLHTLPMYYEDTGWTDYELYEYPL